MESFNIVIPVYNRAVTLARTLDSVLAQTYRPLRVIIVDNNSTDDSMAVAVKWKNDNADSELFVDIFTETKQGAAAARNKGLKEVNSSKMLFFDSDDVMRPNLVEQVMCSFESEPDIDIVFWKAVIHFINNRSSIKKFCHNNLLRNHIYHSILSTQCYAFRTDFMRQNGGWNETALTWDDWELGIRLLLNNPKCKALPLPLVDIYAQEQSITGLNFHSKVGTWEHAIDLALSSIGKSNRCDKNSLMRLVDYRSIVLAAHYKREKQIDIADRLYSTTMSKYRGVWQMQLLMSLVYNYISLGGRGTATIIDKLL